MKTISLLSGLLVLLVSCKTEPTSYNGQYPDDVAAIMTKKCATAGCHNQASFTNAANLRLDNWNELFKGSASGATVIPYSTGNTSLLYFINTDSSQGPVLLPGMPLNAAALSKSEYNTIRSWIAAGAPDKMGNVPFGSDPETRQKIYMTQQGCDLIAVADAATGLIMRYIKIGMSPGNEVPHCVRFSADGRYAYVSFNQGQYMQRIDASADAVSGSVFLGPGAWNIFQISPDGKRMLISDMNKNNGQLKLLNLEDMTVINTFEDFDNPHGIAATRNFDTFFVTSQYGNTIYRVLANGFYKKFSLDGNETHFTANTFDPHEIIMAPDFSKYFLTCEASNEVRVMDPKTNQVIKVIPVGTYPQEFALSHSKPYLFVSCQEEVTPEFPSYRGVVYVINYETLEVIKRIPGPFYQVHGLTVDDQRGLLYVVSRNILVNGPAPHHTSECGGRNGYYNIYDINTFEPYNGRRYESTVDPYSADTRFK
jgi:YVTN family beta-propeller protein